MGAPKQKWTEEEEAALRAGVLKHGTGKWRTILSDPEFTGTLHSRSNVDLKDKWRNINSSAMGGSRQRAKVAAQMLKSCPEHDIEKMHLIMEPPKDKDVLEVTPIAMVSGTPKDSGSKKPVPRLDKLIVEALTSLKEPGGSDKSAITSYIKRKLSWNAPTVKKHVIRKLKLLTENGMLVKAKQKYRLAPGSRISGARNPTSQTSEGRQKDSLKSKKRDIECVSRSQPNPDLWQMTNMSLEEAAAAAAQAVAEAEFAIAEAKQAARQAEVAEAYADAAQIFAEAAELALRPKMITIWRLASSNWEERSLQPKRSMMKLKTCKQLVL